MFTIWPSVLITKTKQKQNDSHMLVFGYNDLAQCSHNKIKVKSETMFDYNDLARCSHNKPKVKSKTIFELQRRGPLFS